jgi:hypothetical protein
VTSSSSIDLYWLPLGAGGHFVRLNGRIYEAIRARAEHRQPLDLYHSALEVTSAGKRFVVENCWPIPDADGSRRGVVVEGPVWDRRLGHLRPFRYEIRRWRDGTIADADHAVASPQRLTDNGFIASRLLQLVPLVPVHVWGRDVFGTGDMWNSNSVIAWLIENCALDADRIHSPIGGRAPGWTTGISCARIDAGSVTNDVDIATG